MRFGLKQLFFAIALLAVVLTFVRAITHVEFGEQVRSVSWLPKSATNVSYYKSYRFTAYEFDIPESDFLDWAKQWPVEPVTKPSTIRRYSSASQSHFLESPISPNLTPGQQFDLVCARWIPEMTIANGCYYEHRSQSNGGGVAVGYDRTNGRAYFQANPR